jgi:hypothetical protein
VVRVERESDVTLSVAGGLLPPYSAREEVRREGMFPSRRQLPRRCSERSVRRLAAEAVMQLVLTGPSVARAVRLILRTNRSG